MLHFHEKYSKMMPVFIHVCRSRKCLIWFIESATDKFFYNEMQFFYFCAIMNIQDLRKKAQITIIKLIFSYFKALIMGFFLQWRNEIKKEKTTQKGKEWKWPFLDSAEISILTASATITAKVFFIIINFSYEKT